MHFSPLWLLPLPPPWVLVPSLGQKQCPCQSCSWPGPAPCADFPPTCHPFPKLSRIESDPPAPSLRAKDRSPCAVSLSLLEGKRWAYLYSPGGTYRDLGKQWREQQFFQLVESNGMDRMGLKSKKSQCQVTWPPAQQCASQSLCKAWSSVAHPGATSTWSNSKW